MVRNDIVKKIAEITLLSKKEADKIVDTFFNGIIESLKKGDRVELRGLGTFGVKNRASKKARNLKTGETINLSARRVPFFRRGTKLEIL